MCLTLTHHIVLLYIVVVVNCYALFSSPQNIGNKCRQLSTTILPFAEVKDANIVLRAMRTDTDPTYSFGMRIDATTLSRKEFQSCFETSWPVVLTNVFDIDNEWWTEQLISRLGNNDVQFDIRQSNDGTVETYEASLSDFIGSLLDESDHENSWYLMDEELLLEDSTLMGKFKLPSRLFGFDFFQHFPELIRPKMALIIGGEGARSFLHVDPYEWTGWNYLLEGRKLWTFIAPDSDREPPLFPWVRNPPDAWGAYNLSAGWVSDVDLYKHRSSSTVSSVESTASDKSTQNNGLSETVNQIDSVPLKPQNSNKINNVNSLQPTVAKIDETDMNIMDIGTPGEGAGRLLGRLSAELITAMTQAASDNGSEKGPELSGPEMCTSTDKKGSAGGPISDRFRSGTSLDSVTDGRLMGGGGALQIEQGEGELVVIPPRWWHQVYHLEPSIAVAGQYFSEGGRDRVFRHILRWCGAQESDLPVHFASMSDQDQVLAVIRTGLIAQFGESKGEQTFHRLVPPTPPNNKPGNSFRNKRRRPS